MGKKQTKYPLNFDSFMAETEQSGLTPSEDVKHFINEIVELINDAYYQGRLDETLCGGVMNE